ncbi:MAG: hypothetical protein RL722_2719 [Pseudomonadota bacterium]|jgi:hypothetical protein
MPSTPPRHASGRKAQLPRKDCLACGRPMVWRRAWAKVWDEVRYCSDACRKRRGTPGGQEKTRP